MISAEVAGCSGGGLFLCAALFGTMEITDLLLVAVREVNVVRWPDVVVDASCAGAWDS